MGSALLPLRDGLTAKAASELVVVLAAFGVDAEVDTSSEGSAVVLVAEHDLERAGAILREGDEAGEEAEGGAGAGADSAAAAGWSSTDPGGPGADGRVRPEAGDAPPLAPSWRWFGRGMVAIAAIGIVCTGAFFWTTSGRLDASYERMLAAGAITSGRIDAGQVWRLAAAVFLHFDLAHLLANLGTLAVVGPILGREIGSLRLIAVFVGSGILGNLASYVFDPASALKAGASGGVAGIIGALGGQALGGGRRGRFRPWQIWGALLAVYALMVGAGSGRDHLAHLGGLLSGVGLGWWLVPKGPASVRSEDRPASEHRPG